MHAFASYIVYLRQNGWPSVDNMPHNLMTSAGASFMFLLLCLRDLCISFRIRIIPLSLTESLLRSCFNNTNSWPLSACGKMPKEDRCLLLWKWHRTATFSSYLSPFKALLAARSFPAYKSPRLHLHSWSCSQAVVPGNMLIDDKTILCWLVSCGWSECNWSEASATRIGLRAREAVKEAENCERRLV